uniref:Coiled-coil domain-containing protein n=1 Tax=Takifugu rubripes TaxID=31033 RepID=A0A674MM84_TAKRU
MPGGAVPNRLSSCYNSTPVKTSQKQDFSPSNRLDKEVLSDDDERFSFLSPIYNDSFDSDEDLEPSASQNVSPVGSNKSSVSPVRCELLRTPSDQILRGTDEPAACCPSLSAWELWLVRKAKEDRFNMQKKAKEESKLKDRREQEEMKRDEKKIVMEEKIQEWLNMKKEQEIKKQLVRQSKEEEEMQKQLEKERENEQKAQQKYKSWLKKKNQEKMELEKKEKEKAALKEERDRVRRKRAEEKFKEWLAKANEKSRDTPKTPCVSTNPFDRSSPSPGYFNPIPWKPIHIPPPENPKEETCSRTPQRQHRSKQSPSVAFRLRTPARPGQFQRR